MTSTVVLVGDLVQSGEAELTTGPFGTQLKASEYTDDGTVPVINVRNVGFGDVRTTTLEYISAEVAQRLSRHLLVPGDIVFGRKGAVERHAFIQDGQSGWLQGSDCLRLRLTSERLISRFVSYFLRTERHQEWMKNHCSHGATMASLNQDILGRIAIPLPSMDVQRSVVGVLSAYDDQIENNRRRIEILEEMAQAVYREWFVEFRYPGHEDVPLVDSDLGPIPEEWKASTIGDASALVTRGVSPKYDETASRIVINQKCIRAGRLSLGLARRHATRVPEQKAVRFGDVLINSTGVGTLGRVAQVYRDMSDSTVDSHVTIVRPRSGVVSPDFFGLALLGRASEFEAMGAGSTGQTELSRTRIGEAPMLVPDHHVQDEFASVVAPMRRLCEALTDANSTLRSTRDLLLPRLISGEVDVSGLDLDLDDLVA